MTSAKAVRDGDKQRMPINCNEIDEAVEERERRGQRERDSLMHKYIHGQR